MERRPSWLPGEEWAGRVPGEHPYHTYPDRRYPRHSFQARESATGRIWKERRYHYFPQKETRKEEGTGEAVEVAGVDRTYFYLWAHLDVGPVTWDVHSPEKYPYPHSSISTDERVV
jgi:hypothetical protein